MTVCPICKYGHFEAGTVTVTLERGNSIILVKNVPAEVCNNCANYFLDEVTTRIILQKAENSVRNGAELEVIQMQAA